MDGPARLADIASVLHDEAGDLPRKLPHKFKDIFSAGRARCRTTLCSETCPAEGDCPLGLMRYPIFYGSSADGPGVGTFSSRLCSECRAHRSFNNECPKLPRVAILSRRVAPIREGSRRSSLDDPILSVVQTVPSIGEEAPALSPHKPIEPSPRPLRTIETEVLRKVSGPESHVPVDIGCLPLFAYRNSCPFWTMLEQIINSHGKIMIRRQQSRASGDDAMPIMVRITSERDVVTVLQTDQALHGIARRRIHANFPVPIERHEAEGWIDNIIHHVEIEPVIIGNRAPVVNSCAAERVDSHADIRVAYGIYIDYIMKVLHISVEKVMPMRCRGAQCVSNAFFSPQPGFLGTR